MIIVNVCVTAVGKYAYSWCNIGADILNNKILFLFKAFK